MKQTMWFQSNLTTISSENNLQTHQVKEMTVDEINCLLQGKTILFKPTNSETYRIRGVVENNILRIFCLAKQRNIRNVKRFFNNINDIINYAYESIPDADNDPSKPTRIEQAWAWQALNKTIPTANFKFSYQNDCIHGDLEVISAWVHHHNQNKIQPC